MDTPDLLGRDLDIFPDVFRVLNPSSAEQEGQAHFHGNALEILYPTDFAPQDNPEQIGAMENFLDTSSKATGRIYRSISIHEDWRKTANVEEKDLHQYLYNVGIEMFIPLVFVTNSSCSSCIMAGTMQRIIHSINSGVTNEELLVHAPFVTEVVRWYWYGTLNSLHFCTLLTSTVSEKGFGKPSDTRTAYIVQR